jgi:hypothetical protein
MLALFNISGIRLFNLMWGFSLKESRSCRYTIQEGTGDMQLPSSSDSLYRRSYSLLFVIQQDPEINPRILTFLEVGRKFPSPVQTFTMFLQFRKTKYRGLTIPMTRTGLERERKMTYPLAYTREVS